MDEEKNAPSSKLLKILAVGRRANAGGSAVLDCKFFGKSASLLSVSDASLDEVRVNLGCRFVGKCKDLKKERDCSS